MPKKSVKQRSVDNRTSIHGNADIDGGDFVGRDKVIQNIQLDTEKLARVITQTALGKSELDEKLLSFEDKNPYRGLLAFSEIDSQFFYGREMAINLLADLTIRYQPLVTVIGNSGSGKSSLVSAGLIPRLTKSNSGWIVVKFRPGSNPFEELASALYAIDQESKNKSSRIVEVTKLASVLENGKLSLEQVAQKILKKSQIGKHLILVIDQFEELYTLCSDIDTRLRFLDLLTTWVLNQKPTNTIPLMIVVALRADFLSQVLTYRPLADAFDKAATLMLGPMSLDELHTAITYPALRQGGKFDDGLPSRILDDAGQKSGNLPLLEFVLTLLWERQESGKLTHRAYDALGKVQGALAHYADQIYARLSKDDKELARQIFIQLVQPGEGTEDTRRRAMRKELGDQKWRVVQDLAGSRLLVTSQDMMGEPAVEVVHEALIQKWDQLREWMNEDRVFRIWQEQLRVAMRQWEASERDTRALLSGWSLDRAVNWLNNHEPNFSKSEIDYINISSERQNSEDQRLQDQIETVQKLQVELIAERQLNSLGRAMAAIEHRLNNTLNIIVPNIHRLRKRIKSDDADVLEILDIIERNARYTSQLIDRIQTPLLEVDWVEVDINAILNEIGEKASTQKISLVLDFDTSIPVVSLPIGQISEVFTNLINNSLRAMKQEGTLRVKTKLVGDKVHVMIADTGLGIPSQLKERLFKKPVPPRVAGEGTGLGLWLSKLILDSIGGDISVDATGPFGTTMVVKVPTKRANHGLEV